MLSPISKQALRRELQARRSALPDETRRRAAAAVAGRVRDLVEAGHAVVAGYVPMRGELDPMPALIELQARGAQTALPVIVGPDRPLGFRRWRSGEPLEAGPLRTQQPLAAHEGADPDLLLVPLCGFDAACNRLGYGAGFYDRTLAALRARKRLVAVGLAFEVQAAERIPVDPHDELLDFVVTEARVLARPERSA